MKACTLNLEDHMDEEMAKFSLNLFAGAFVLVVMVAGNWHLLNF